MPLRMPALLVLAVAFCGAAGAEEADPAYLAQFVEDFPRVEPPADWESYASAERFDALYLAEGWNKGLADLHNDSGGIAWGTSYRMMAFNGMYAATADAKYLEANLQLIQAVLAAADDKRGKTLGDGRTVAAWGCEQYSKKGRAVHAVHTGIIAAPVLEFLLLARGHEGLRERLGADADGMAAAAVAALEVHAEQWSDGPGVGEGYYRFSELDGGDTQQPLPGNWQSAMGWAWYRAGKLLDNEGYRERGIKLGRFIKNRLRSSTDGAYYWEYQLPLEPAAGEIEKDAIAAEDTSHAFLTMALPFELAQDGVLLDQRDLERLGRTVVNGFVPRDDGVVYPRINGNTGLDPGNYIAYPSNWLWLARYVPEVENRLAAFYTKYCKTPAPLELADILVWRVEKQRGAK